MIHTYALVIMAFRKRNDFYVNVMKRKSWSQKLLEKAFLTILIALFAHHVLINCLNLNKRSL